jgi:hypothetical protein
MIRIDNHTIMKTLFIIAAFAAYVIVVWSVGVSAYTTCNGFDPNCNNLYVSNPSITNDPEDHSYHIDRIPLNKPTTFFFKKGFNVANRNRYQPSKQMICEGPFCNEITLPDVIRCETPGNGQVKCYANIPNGYELDKTELECEPFWNDNDPCILRDSCSVTFTLKKYVQPFTEYLPSKPANNGLWVLLFGIIIIAFILIMCYLMDGEAKRISNSRTFINTNVVDPYPLFYQPVRTAYPTHYSGTYQTPSFRPLSEQLVEAKTKLSSTETHLSTGTGTINKPSPKIDNTIPSSKPAPAPQKQTILPFATRNETPKPENETHLSTGTGSINPPKQETHLSTGTGGFRKRNTGPRRVSE